MSMPGDVLREASAARPLAGRHIVVTRPVAQVGALAAAIEQAGGIAVRFPVLEILDLADHAPLREFAARLDDFDLAVFVSPNAVDKALSVLTTQRAWPPRLRVAAIGKSTERALARFGIADVIAPQVRFDSEALLERPELRDMAGRRVIVFRGDGGRELLGDTLRVRGATVDHLTCYRRGVPQADPAPLLDLWRQGWLDAFVITSSEGLRNLVTLVGVPGEEMLARTPLFVPHPRIAEEAHRLGLGLQCTVSTGPGDAGILAGLIEHFNPKTAVDLLS